MMSRLNKCGLSSRSIDAALKLSTPEFLHLQAQENVGVVGMLLPLRYRTIAEEIRRLYASHTPHI